MSPTIALVLMIVAAALEPKHPDPTYKKVQGLDLRQDLHLPEQKSAPMLMVPGGKGFSPPAVLARVAGWFEKLR